MPEPELEMAVVLPLKPKAELTTKTKSSQTTINIAIWRNAGMYCYNLYPYLVLPQKYECRESAAGEWQKCEALT